MTVEKHFLQDWQERVLLLQLPVGLCRLPFSPALLGPVQELGAFLGEVFHGLVVHGCHGQLGVHVCKEQIARVTIRGWGLMGD